MKHPQPQRYAISSNGMIATQHDLATQAGVEILESGGNAFDAAVAAAFALSVCEPQGSGLGGQSLAILYHAHSKKTAALDGSSRAPNRATVATVSKRERKKGYKSATVPSTPAVLDYIRRRYGTFRLSALLEPAIRIAQEGYSISHLQHSLLSRELKKLRKTNARRFFLKRGRPYAIGDLFRQPVLAKTLKRLAKKGVKDFYRGKIAELICKDMLEHQGLIQQDDLAQIPWPIERQPLVGRFQNFKLATFPPPGAGRTLIEIMNLLRQIPKSHRMTDTPKGALYLAEIIQKASQDRMDRPYDPNFYPQIRNKKMLSKEYAARVMKRIQKRLRSGETTHLSVMDREGNVIGITQSIERVYGSRAVNPKLGFLYNNYMMSFEFEDITHPFFLRPNAVPWASAAPTILFKQKRPWLVIGSPGSERISPAIAQTLLHLQKLDPYEAVRAPRLHCSLTGEVSLENRFGEATLKLLRSKKFKIDLREDYSFYFGCISMVLREGDQFIGAADPRRDGSVGGPHHIAHHHGKKRR